MKFKFFSLLLMTLIAFVFMSGGVTGGSVAEGVYLSLPGVAEYVYTPTSATKGLTRLSAINKNVEIDFGKENYLLYGSSAISGSGFGVFVRDNAKLPTNNNATWNGRFSQSRAGAGYVNHTTDWIIKPLSPVYTIIPVDDFSSYNVEGSNGNWDANYNIISPSTIALKYDSSMSDLYDTVSVLYRVYDNAPWEILPGVMNNSQKKVSAAFTRNGFGSYCVVSMDSDFNEFSGAGSANVNWSQQYVTSLWTKGIMSQTRSGGYFGLVDGMLNEYSTTRGEFASMLVKGMRLPLESLDANIFSDVNAVPDLHVDGINYEDFYPNWREYACTAAKYGLVSGVRNGASLEFQPGEYITREQAAALIARTAKLKLEIDNENGGKVDQALAKLYKSDYTHIGRWARPYVLAVTKAKYMEGFPDPANPKDRVFNPGTPITRAQTAKIVYALLKNLKRI